MIFVRKIKTLIRMFFYKVCRLLPIESKKVVIVSYYGKGYGDNSKYIVDYLLKGKRDLEIIWAVREEKDAVSLPDGVKYCLINTLQYIYHISTAKVWIDNCRKNCIKKRNNQKYLQTWHGFALKRIERDAEQNLGEKYVKKSIKDSRNIDLIVSDSKFMTKLYKNSFWYNGEVVEWGSPRNDIFFEKNKEISKRVREHFNISGEKGIILYAPTFRADLSLKSYLKEFDAVIKACSEKFNKEFVVIMRLHPNISDKSKELGLDGKAVYNGSFYPDMQELLCESDVLITDYSSIMFDFSLTDKPCFLYATDIEDYKEDRNFYFEIDKLPYQLSTNIEQLTDKILKFDNEKYKTELGKFFDSVGMIRDGKASEKCADLICDWCQNK